MRSVFLKIIIAVLIFSSFFAIIHQTLDPDFGWHLREGERILAGGAVNLPDQYSFTMSGYQWVNHEWLSDTFLAFFRANHLWFLVEIFFTFLIFAPFFYWIYKLKNSEEWILIFLSFVAVINFASVRPQMISFFLFWIFLQVLIFRFSEKWKQKYFSYYIFFSWALFLMWANFHGGFFSAITAWGIFIAVEAFKNWREVGKFFYKYCELDIVAIFGSVILTLVNPFGWRIYEEIFNVFTNKLVSSNVIEWFPLSNFVFSRPDYIVFICLFLAFSIFSWRKLKLNHFLVAIFFLLNFILHMRMGVFFLLSAIPLMFQSLDDFRKQFERVPKLFVPSMKTKVFLSIPIVLIFGISCYGFFNFLLNVSIFYPKDAGNYLNELIKEKKPIKLFNDYGWGGYLVDNVRGVKVFIDGRMAGWKDEHGYSALEEFLSVVNKKNNQWRKVFDKYNINTVFIPTVKNEGERQEPSIPRWKEEIISFIPEKLFNYLKNLNDGELRIDLYGELLKDKDWEMSFQDDQVAIFRKKGS